MRGAVGMGRWIVDGCSEAGGCRRDVGGIEFSLQVRGEGGVEGIDR